MDPLQSATHEQLYKDSVWSGNDMMVICVDTEANSFTQVIQLTWLKDTRALSNAVLDEQILYIAGISQNTLKGLTKSVDPDRQPKNYYESMSWKDRQDWAEAYAK